MNIFTRKKKLLATIADLEEQIRIQSNEMDKLRNADGQPIPRDTPYAVLLESNTPLVVQYSRLDTSAAEMALMTTIAYPVEE